MANRKMTKDTQRSTKHTNKTKDRVSHTPHKTSSKISRASNMIASLVSSNFPEIKHTHLWCCFLWGGLMFIYFCLITKHLYLSIYLSIFNYLFLQSRFHDIISLPTTRFINWNCVCRRRICFSCIKYI